MPFYEQSLSDPEILGTWEVNYAPGPLDEMKVACSMTSFYALPWGYPVDGIGDLLPAGPKRTLFRGDESQYRDGWVQALEVMWGITTREHTLETVTALLDYPSDSLYPLLRPQLQELVNAPIEHRGDESQRLQDVVVRAHRGLKEDALREAFASWCKPFLHSESVETLPAVLPYHVAGWNTARAGWVLRMAHSVGYVTAADVQPLMLRALTVTRAWCGSWREFADSFLVGRAQWDEEPDEEWFSLRNRIAFCLSSDKMPWAHVPLHP